MKAPIREDTRPTIYSLPSMKNLQLIISTASGLLLPGCSPGTVGSHLYKLARLRLRVIRAFTLVKTHAGKAVQCLFKDCFKFMFPNPLGVGLVLDPVNISGKYPGNEWPVPAGNAGPAFYRRSALSTASKGKYPAWMPVWHWLFFPAALSCKVQPVVSYLLY